MKIEKRMPLNVEFFPTNDFRYNYADLLLTAYYGGVMFAGPHFTPMAKFQIERAMNVLVLPNQIEMPPIFVMEGFLAEASRAKKIELVIHLRDASLALLAQSYFFSLREMISGDADLREEKDPVLMGVLAEKLKSISQKTEIEGIPYAEAFFAPIREWWLQRFFLPKKITLVVYGNEPLRGYFEREKEKIRFS